MNLQLTPSGDVKWPWSSPTTNSLALIVFPKREEDDNENVGGYGEANGGLRDCFWCPPAAFGGYNLLIHCQLFASFESRKNCVICILPPSAHRLFTRWCNFSKSILFSTNDVTKKDPSRRWGNQPIKMWLTVYWLSKMILDVLLICN